MLKHKGVDHALSDRLHAFLCNCVVTEVFSTLTSDHGQVQRPCDPGQPIRMGPVCGPREV